MQLIVMKEYSLNNSNNQITTTKIASLYYSLNWVIIWVSYQNDNGANL